MYPHPKHARAHSLHSSPFSPWVGDTWRSSASCGHGGGASVPRRCPCESTFATPPAPGAHVVSEEPLPAACAVSLPLNRATPGWGRTRSAESRKSFSPLAPVFSVPGDALGRELSAPRRAEQRSGPLLCEVRGQGGRASDADVVPLIV